uniref:Uncharacterized protein n=1 Tax=Ciona intestinalis TaxID=7719 RepID=H2XLE8_CIOIN
IENLIKTLIFTNQVPNIPKSKLIPEQNLFRLIISTFFNEYYVTRIKEIKDKITTTR